MLALCLFWAGARDADGRLVAFAYVTGMGLEHAYLEDVIVHPDCQGEGIGRLLVCGLLEEADKREISIVSVNYEPSIAGFYEKSGFAPCLGGVWRHSQQENESRRMKK